MQPLVLASTSSHRRTLLERLGLPFTTADPAVDEAALAAESPAALAARLAEAKARAVARAHPGALIVGSDQVASLDGRVLGKPGGHDANVAQLRASAGRRVQFCTGLCLLDAATDRACTETVHFAVRFRALTQAQIEAYVRRERAFDCAGGFRSENLGVALFEGMEGEDPTALIGLPLIRLVGMLEAAGVDVLLDGERAGDDAVEK